MSVNKHIRDALSNTKMFKKFCTCNFTFMKFGENAGREKSNCYTRYIIDDILNGIIFWKRV